MTDRGLFSVDYMTHAQCWGPGPVTTVNGVTDLLIALCYLLMGVLLARAFFVFKDFSLRFWNRHYYLSFLCFAAFIASCGTGHLIDFLSTWWWPVYRLKGLMNCLTVATSAGTVGAVAWRLRQFTRDVKRADKAMTAIQTAAGKMEGKGVG